jgi:peroxiredoxin
MELARKIKQKINQEGPTIISLYASGQLNPEVDFVFMDSLARVFKVAKKGEMQGVEAFVENLDRISKVREGAMAPAIELPNTEGKALSLASLKGKVVLVDFWASWCGPCRRANPEVVKLYKANKSKGFTVLGVSLDEDKGKWLEAIKKDGLEWNHVSDLKRWESPTAAVWQVASLPSTFLIDQDGKIVGRNLHGPALEAKVAELLAKKNS